MIGCKISSNHPSAAILYGCYGWMALLLVAGCTTKSNAVKAPSSEVKEQAISSTDILPPKDMKEDPSPTSLIPSIDPAVQEDSTSIASSGPQKWRSRIALEQGMADGHWTWQRWQWLTQGGPLSMDLVAHMGMRSIRKLQDEIAPQVMQRLFPEQTSVTWDMVWDQPCIRDGFFAHIKAESPAKQSQLTKKYDLDKDGVASPQEILSLLTRGQSVVGIVLEDAKEYRNDNRDHTPLFLALDADGSGSLSNSEIAESANRLLRLDSNGDYLLSRNELLALQDVMASTPSGLQVEALPLVVIGEGNGKQSTQLLEEHYAVQRSVPRDAWLDRLSLFDQLDTNRNSRLTTSELRGIWEMEASFGLEVDWGPSYVGLQPSNDQKSDTGSIGMWADPSIPSLSILDGNEKGIEHSRIRIRITTLDMLRPDVIPERMQRYAEAMGVSRERPAAIVEGLGGPSLRFSPKGLDRDQDGRLNWAELEWGVDLKTIISSTYMRVRLADVPDGWFTWLDLNWDGILSEDEIHRSADRLRTLIALQSASDSELAPESLPVQLQMVLVRPFADEDPFPNGFVDQQLFQRKPAVSAPAWFSAMDVNGDGLVTPREFIGSEDDLRSFDKNKNGWLDALDFEGLTTNPD